MKTRFFADYVNETLMLSQGSVLVMETVEVNLVALLRKLLKNHQQKDLVLIMIQIQILI